MKTAGLSTGGRIYAKSEAYLEGMKTLIQLRRALSAEMSEAYLEGMKTKQIRR